MRKKISLGISPKWDLDETLFLLNKYKDYLYSIYYSPIVDGFSFTTMKDTEVYNDILQTRAKIRIIAKEAVQNKIKNDVVLNAPNIHNNNHVIHINPYYRCFYLLGHNLVFHKIFGSFF